MLSTEKERATKELVTFLNKTYNVIKGEEGQYLDTDANLSTAMSVASTWTDSIGMFLGMANSDADTIEILGMQLMSMKSAGLSDSAMKLYSAYVKGRIKYVERHGSLPHSMSALVDTILDKGVATATRHRH
jgi:hypothetical protein